MTLPKRTLPTPLRGVELGTFTHYTLTVRMPEIGRRIIPENQFPPEIVARLQALIGELTDPGSRIRPLEDPGAPDEVDWERYTRPYRGMNWLEAPWFFAETYYYRRILEATRYFQPGPWWGYDPYSYQKQQGLASFQAPIQASCELVNAWLSTPAAGLTQAQERLENLIILNLWGNQADLSLWPVEQGDQTRRERPDHTGLDQQRAHLLVDHSREAAAYLLGGAQGRSQIDFILDNAGLELMNDLLLADYLISTSLTAEVNFHLKAHPTFVSDAIPTDVFHTLDFLAGMGDTAALAVSNRLRAYLETQRLRLSAHFYWNSPLAMWESPEDLHETLGCSALIISKGDANYRRLTGDRHWPFDTPLSEVWDYLPAPLLALRVSKSENMIGLKTGQAQEVERIDPKWLSDGRWGQVQFNQPASTTSPYTPAG